MVHNIMTLCMISQPVEPIATWIDSCTYTIKDSTHCQYNDVFKLGLSPVRLINITNVTSTSDGTNLIYKFKLPVS